MLNELIKLADRLDSKGLKEEADYLDKIVEKYAQESTGIYSGSNWGYVGGQLQKAGAPASLAELKGQYDFFTDQLGQSHAVKKGTEHSLKTAAEPTADELNYHPLLGTRNYFTD
jgi:hypothetical protein